MTSEQRRQTAYSILALRVGPLFRLSGVARRLSRNRGTGYAPSSRLGEAKNLHQPGMAEFFNRLLRREAQGGSRAPPPDVNRNAEGALS